MVTESMIFWKKLCSSSSSPSLDSRRSMSSLCSGLPATWEVLKVISIRFLPTEPDSTRLKRAKYLSPSFSGIMPVLWLNSVIISLLSLTKQP